MIVNVAGAGAGKTTKMADFLLDKKIPKGKIVFCIAFTNDAVKNIKEKITEKQGNIPENIRISTIHSFLYKEFIDTYYYFLYKKQFERISTVELPNDNILKSKKTSDLEENNILHITKIPEKAKWVVYKKSSDKKATKDIREKIILRFRSYCASIFIDEAQDINKDMYDILSALDNAGIEIVLYGDPKQDVKGFNCFRDIINNTDNVTYISECHRCPQKHLNLSNTLATENEKQIADEGKSDGNLEIVFESDLDDIKNYINSSNYDLCFISKKYHQFCTHRANKDDRFEKLYYFVFQAMAEKYCRQRSEIERKRFAFSITENMLKDYDLSGNAEKQISYYVNNGTFDLLNKKNYYQMISSFSAKPSEADDTIIVRSIEIIKGLEAERCLFILTPDLAPYLFKTKNDDNKTRHLLYVALTRSKNHLTILITQDIEKSFSKSIITNFFSTYTNTTT